MELKGAQQPLHRLNRQPHSRARLLQRQAAWCIRQQLNDPERAIHRLNQSPLFPITHSELL